MSRRRMRVLTWNLHGSARPDLVAVGELLLEVAADVIGLQEVRRGQAETLAEAIGSGGLGWSLKHRPYGPLLPSTAEGLALLLPEPAEVGATELNPGASRWAARRRIVQHTVLREAGVQVLNTHLDAHDPDPRRDQAARLARLVDPAGPVVLLGDLNATPLERGVFEALAEAGLRDVWDREAGATRASFTSPAGAPVQRIDHILVSKQVEVVEVAVPAGEWSRFSDHLPVCADLLLPRADAVAG